MARHEISGCVRAENESRTVRKARDDDASGTTVVVAVDGGRREKSPKRRIREQVEAVRRSVRLVLKTRDQDVEAAGRDNVREVNFEIDTEMTVEQLDEFTDTVFKSIEHAASALEEMAAARAKTHAEMDGQSIQIERKQRETQKILDELCGCGAS